MSAHLSTVEYIMLF